MEGIGRGRGVNGVHNEVTVTVKATFNLSLSVFQPDLGLRSDRRVLRPEVAQVCAVH